MLHRPLIRLTARLLALAGFLALADRLAASSEETIEQSFKVSDTPKIDITGFNGKVEIEVGSGGSVEVKAVKYVQSLVGFRDKDALEKIQLTMTQEGDTVRLHASKPQNLLCNTGVSFHLRVPAKSDVVARTSNGPIRIQGLVGSADVRTSNGSVRVEDGAGRLIAQTTNGTIQTDFKGEQLNLTSTNGSITVDGHAANLVAETTNGRVCIDLEDGPSQVKVGTTNGSIQFEGGLVGQSEFGSTNGSIALRLPASLDFAVDAKTSNGSIRNEFEMNKVETKSKRALRATRGESPQTSIKVRTSNSSILLGEG